MSLGLSSGSGFPPENKRDTAVILEITLPYLNYLNSDSIERQLARSFDKMPDEQWTVVRGITNRALLAGAALFAAGFLTSSIITKSSKKTQIVRSPRATLLPQLSVEEQSSLPYPPDSLPGARDVDSPYGSLRVYEWGPETGDKVLLIHGISTPCLALGAVAHGLVDAGCYVMLFDLLGRGYSDTPADLPHDVRLFTSQILLALASSPLSWTGRDSGGFSVVGYSLGGGIGANFTSHFPALVNSLVLIAPSGIIRPHHFSRLNRVVYSEGLLPEPLLHSIVRQRLQTPLYPRKKEEQHPQESGVLAPVKAEINIEANPATVLSQSHPDVTIESAVSHQVLHHEGFVAAFMSSIRNGPITMQHSDWKRIGQRLADQKAGKTNSLPDMKQGKILVIGGSKDPIIKQDELEADASEVFQGNAVFKFVEAGHEVPVVHGDVVSKQILDFWAGK